MISALNDKHLHDEAAAYAFVEARVWPEGPVCPHCGGVDRIGKKIGEEAAEVIIAAKNADAAELTWEVADLLYHTLVMLQHQKLPLDAIWGELRRRHRA